MRLNDIRVVVVLVGLAVSGAEKILKREIDSNVHAQLLQGLEAELR